MDTSKQNMNNPQSPSGGPEGSGEEVRRDFKGLVGSVRNFVLELFDLRVDTDQQATIAAIKADIPFKGHTSWILICSIFIASVGLNANSTAVVIGAMLISPLMGPILGVGLSLAINDIDTLRRSLKNFITMVVLSVLTAYFFFKFFPLRNESSELLARTAPDIRDVLIAFFGGLALVIARAKRGTMASVIYGVAIATALMPPLCTVGFGLAIGNYDYASGAMYLFIINTIFIALATFLIIRLLGFPMVKYVNSKRRRAISRIAYIVAVLVIIPAGIAFYDTLQESIFKQEANQFIKDKVSTYQFAKGGRFLENFSEIKYNRGKDPTIELLFMGNETIPDNVIATWHTQMKDYPKLNNCKLRIIQGSQDSEADQFKYINELYETQKSELLDKDQKISLLESEVVKLNKFASMQIPFDQISSEARANYSNIEKLGFASTIITDFKKQDTIPVFEVKWKKGVPHHEIQNDTKRLTAWLKVRLKDSTVMVLPFDD